MSSPYTPPRSKDPALPYTAGNRVRLTVRILGLGSVMAAAALSHVLGKLSPILRDVEIFDQVSTRMLALALLRSDAALPFLTAMSLAAIGIALSFRDRARPLPMLAFVIASFLLTGVAYLGMWFLIGEFVRITGGA